MKYKSELIKEIMDTRGHESPLLHYESECIEKWIKETKGAYPKLCDYESEWLNYMTHNEIGKFPYVTVSANPTASVNNVVPYAYKSAILKGNTKYRDIDTGDILDTFDETKNLELVSVKMPVLTTTGKNLFDKTKLSGGEFTTFNGKNVYKYYDNGINFKYNGEFEKDTQYTLSMKIYRDDTNIDESTAVNFYYSDGTISSKNLSHNSFVILTSEIGKTVKEINGAWNYSKNVYIDLDVTQLEQGTTATSYEPHKSNILSCNEEVELRGIGEVQDTLDCLTGQVTQRIGEIVLDGSEEWEKNNIDINSFYFHHNESLSFGKIITDNYPIINSFEDKTNGIFKGRGAFGIIKNDIENEEQLKQWLSQNPITVQYQLATESIKTVDLSIVNQDGNVLIKIKPIEGTMYLKTNGEILKPTFTGEVPVEAITQNLASFNKLEMEE